MTFYVILAALMLVGWLLSKAFGWFLDVLFALVWGDDEAEQWVKR